METWRGERVFAITNALGTSHLTIASKQRQQQFGWTEKQDTSADWADLLPPPPASTQYGYGRIRYVLTEREPSALLEDPQSGLQRPHLVLWQGTKAAQGDSFIRLWNDTTTQQYCLLISVFGGEAEDNVKLLLVPTKRRPGHPQGSGAEEAFIVGYFVCIKAGRLPPVDACMLTCRDDLHTQRASQAGAQPADTAPARRLIPLGSNGGAAADPGLAAGHRAHVAASANALQAVRESFREQRGRYAKNFNIRTVLDKLVEKYGSGPYHGIPLSEPNIILEPGLSLAQLAPPMTYVATLYDRQSETGLQPEEEPKNCRCDGDEDNFNALVRLRTSGVPYKMLISQTESRGAGVIALEDIPAETPFAEYVGEKVHVSQEGHPSSHRGPQSLPGASSAHQDYHLRQEAVDQQLGFYYTFHMPPLRRKTLEGETLQRNKRPRRGAGAGAGTSDGAEQTAAEAAEESSTVTLVDATYIGNVARFINNSCRPNCRVEGVSVETSAGHDQDNTAQRLLLITKEFIRAGTELTLQYDPLGTRPATITRFNRCLCGEPDCRGYMFGDKASPGASPTPAQPPGPADITNTHQQPAPTQEPPRAKAYKSAVHCPSAPRANAETTQQNNSRAAGAGQSAQGTRQAGLQAPAPVAVGGRRGREEPAGNGNGGPSHAGQGQARRPCSHTGSCEEAGGEASETHVGSDHEPEPAGVQSNATAAWKRAEAPKRPVPTRVTNVGRQR